MLREEPLHGFVLHRKPYKESSFIVHFYSLEHGRMDGILRRQSAQPFQACILHASGKHELKIFTRFEAVSLPYEFHADALVCGFYLNELLLRLTLKDDAQPILFGCYSESLSLLSQFKGNSSLYLKQILRRFEHQLLEILGYGVTFQHDIQNQLLDPESFYQFIPLEGFRINHDAKGQQGKEILAIQQGLATDIFSLNQLQLQLLNGYFQPILQHLLGDAPLRSKELWLSRS